MNAGPEDAGRTPLEASRGDAAVRWGRELLIAAIVLLAGAGLQLGMMLLMRSMKYVYAWQAVGTMAVGAVWVALAAPALAASASNKLGGLIRSGSAADSTFVVLVVVWLVGRGSDNALSFISVLQVYLTCLAMALAGWALVDLGRRDSTRLILAAVASFLLMAMLATPFYADGVRAACPPSLQQTVVSLAVYLNPFYSIASATADPLNYVVTQAPFMYDRVSMLGEHSTPPCPWWAASAVLGSATLVLLVIAAICDSRRGKQTISVP